MVRELAMPASKATIIKDDLRQEALKESLDLDIMLVHAENLMQVHAMLSEWIQLVEPERLHWPDQPETLPHCKREVDYFNREKRCAVDLHIRPGTNTYLTERNFKGFLSELQSDNVEGTRVAFTRRGLFRLPLLPRCPASVFASGLVDGYPGVSGRKKNLLDYTKIMTIARKIRADEASCWQ